MKLKRKITLRPTTEGDLSHLFEIQLDKNAIQMAAFTPKDPTDKIAYYEKWKRLLTDLTINIRTIVVNDLIVGSIAKYVMEGEAEITYWIDKEYWGQGIASNALINFLEIERKRPIFGRVAFDNSRSQKVLEKCGFMRIEISKGYANARGKEIEEIIYRLD